MNIQRLKTWHRRISIVIAFPLFIIIFSGIALQLRGVVTIIQPPTVNANKILNTNILTMEAVERLQRSYDNAPVDQIIYRPNKNNFSIRFTSGREVQIHAQTGKVLSDQRRHTSWLIDIHQGSLWGNFSQYGIFLFSSLGLLFVLITGIVLFFKVKRLL